MNPDNKLMLKENLFLESEKFFSKKFEDLFGALLYLKKEETNEIECVIGPTELHKSTKEDEIKLENAINVIEEKYKSLANKYRNKTLEAINNYKSPFNKLPNRFERVVITNLKKLNKVNQAGYFTIIEQWATEFDPEIRKNHLFRCCIRIWDTNKRRIDVEEFEKLDDKEIKEIEINNRLFKDSLKLFFSGFNLLFKSYQELYSKYLDIIDKIISRIEIDYYTTTQQILIVYYLFQENLLRLRTIHQDQTIQAKLLCALLNRNYNNIYKHWNKITRDIEHKKYFNSVNLNKVNELFNELKSSEQINNILKRIEEELRHLR